MMDENMMCKNFKYEVGKTYEMKKDVDPHVYGFHFCNSPIDCLLYYDNIKGEKRLFLVESGENTIEGIDKYVTDKITILKELDICDYIRKHKDEVDWICISERQKLSEEFIREFQDYVDWEDVSEYQELSEDLIREYKDCINWYWISYSQKLSEEFIREFKHKVNWHWINIYQELSDEFRKEFEEYLK